MTKDSISMSKTTIWIIISAILAVLLVISLFTGGFGIGSGDSDTIKPTQPTQEAKPAEREQAPPTPSPTICASYWSAIAVQISLPSSIQLFPLDNLGASGLNFVDSSWSSLLAKVKVLGIVQIEMIIGEIRNKPNIKITSFFFLIRFHFLNTIMQNIIVNLSKNKDNIS